MKFRPVGTEMSHADTQTDTDKRTNTHTHTQTTEIVVVFRYFSKAPNNDDVRPSDTK